MDRREFLEQVAAWSAGACLATPVFNVSSILAAEGKAKGGALLAVVTGKDYGALVQQVMKPLGGAVPVAAKAVAWEGWQCSTARARELAL